MRAILFGICLCSGVTAGCLDIEQSFKLEKNLSGTASLKISMNVDSVAAFLARAERASHGDMSPPSPEEILRARQQFLNGGKHESTADFERHKRDLAGRLPGGVTLLDATCEEDEQENAFTLVFGFDHLSKLIQIQLPGRVGSDAADNPITFPFRGLRISDEGKTLVVTGAVPNPIAQPPAAAQMLPAERTAAESTVAAMFPGLRFVIKITSPLTSLEHNATGSGDATLVWDYDAKKLAAMTAEQSNAAIRVRYEK